MLINSPNISGSLTVTGNATISGSLNVAGGINATITGSATSASYVEYSNVANKPTLVSGSEQISFNGIVDKPTLVSGSSQIVYSGISSIPAGIVSGSSQISFNGIVDKPTLVSGSSQVTYSGLSGIPVGIVSSSAQVGGYGIFATTGSNQFDGSQAITGSLTVTGQVVAQTLNVQQVTSSIVFSSGSNIFGNSLSNTQQFTGSVSVTGSLSVNGIATSGTVSGTTNYVAKFTGATTIGNSVIEESSSLIGINVTPTRVLHLSSSGSNSAIRLDNTTSGRPFLLTYDDSQNLTFINSSDSGYTAFNSGTGASTTKMLLTNSGNLGLGVTPSAWFTGAKVIQVLGAALEGRTTVTQLWANGYVDAGANGNFYQYNGFASKYTQAFGEHQWFTAPSGTAGDAITFTQAMTLSAAGRLLIGKTNDEGFALDVVGTGRFSGSASTPVTLTLTSANSNCDITMQSTNSSSVSRIRNGTNDLQFHTNGTLALTLASNQAATFSSSVTATGGTASYSTSALPTATISTTTTGAINAAYTSIRIGARGQFGQDQSVAITNVPTADGNSAIAFTTIDSYSYAERMRITSGGNVLIGTTSDNGARLQVSGTGSFTGSITSLINIAGIQNQLILENVNTAEGLDGNSIYFKGYQGSLAKISAYGIPTQQVGGYLQLQSYSDNTTANIGLIIHQGGNVSINNTNNSFQLDVSGTLRVTGAATFSSSVTANYISSIISSSSNASPLILQNTSGWGSSQITSISVKDASDVVGAIGWKYDGVANVDMLFHSLYNGGYKTTSDVVMTVKGTGNVGIGTTSPNNLLTLYSASSAIYTQWVQSGTGTSSTDGLRIGLDASSNGIINLNEGTALITSIDGTERMRITSDGNVVINSTVANHKFQVNSGINTSSATVISLQQATNGAVKDAAAFGLAIQNGGESTNAADLIISTANGGSLGERLRITSGGRIGIGTNSPPAMFTTRGSGNWGTDFNTELLPTDNMLISSEMTNDAYNSILQLVSVRQSLTTGNASQGFLGFSTVDDSNSQGIRDAGRIAIVNEVTNARNSATALAFWTNAGGTNTTAATEKVRITSGGNVGIGTDDFTTSNGNVGKLLKISSNNNNIIVAESSTTERGLIIENRRTSRSGSARNVQLQLYSDASDNGYFSFLTANTGAGVEERMRITSGGNVGIGTDNPQTKLQINQGTNLNVGFNTTSVDSVTTSRITSYNDAFNLSLGLAINGIPLVFQTGGDERMRITSGGYLKASNDGTYSNPTGTFHEFRTSLENNNVVYLVNTASSNPYGPYINFLNAAPNDSTRYFLLCADSTAARLEVRSNGGIANYQANDVNLSDERTKKDIEPLESYWDKFKDIQIVKFKYKDQTHNDYNIGVIAQQVESVAPEFVDVDGWDTKPKLDEEGNTIISEEEPLKSIYTADLHHATIKVLQEAMAKIESLEAILQRNNIS